MRLARAGTILWRVGRDVRGVVGTNGLGHLLLVTTSLIMAGGVAIWALEPSIHTLEDGLWWSIVTTTTVGYGDIASQSSVGRVVAVLLMLVGIGTLGMITGSIATYFIGLRQAGSSNPHVQHIESHLQRWDAASPAEKRQLAIMLMALAESENAVTATAAARSKEGDHG